MKSEKKTVEKIKEDTILYQVKTALFFGKLEILVLITYIYTHQYVKYCFVIYRNTDCAGSEVC